MSPAHITAIEEAFAISHDMYLGERSLFAKLGELDKLAQIKHDAKANADQAEELIRGLRERVNVYERRITQAGSDSQKINAEMQ